MTTAPASLLELGKYWEAHGGVNLGIVGNTAHTKGYHLGRDRIYDGSGPGVGDQDYSVQHPRDRAGLTTAASAIDLGRLNGSLDDLYRFSRELVRACSHAAPGSRDVREIIYSPDGQKVQRWSGIDGAIHEGPGNGDATHLTHTHISYFRDSQRRSKVGLFAPLLEADMPAVTWYPIAGGDGTVVLKPGRGLVDLVTGRRYVPEDVEKISHGRVNADGIGAGFLVRDSGHGCLALDEAVLTFTPTTPPEPMPMHRYVITVDAQTISVTQDGDPIE